MIAINQVDIFDLHSKYLLSPIVRKGKPTKSNL